MEFKQLEAFIAVFEQKSFSKASGLVYLSQPAISNQVASLERELGTQLFIRGSKEISPTREGRLLYRYACDILDKRDGAVQTLHNVQNMAASTVVSIGAYSVATRYYLSQLIADFQKRHRQVSFRIYPGDSLHIQQNVIDGKIELGITGIHVSSPQCESTELVTDRWVIITPNTPRYRSWLPRRVAPAQLARERFICREPGSGTRKDTDLFLTQLGINLDDLKITAEVDDTDSIIQLAACGVGVSVVSQRAAELFARFGHILIFEFDAVVPLRPIYLLRNQNISLSTPAQKFYDFALKYYL